MARVSAAAADNKTETVAEQEHQVLYRKFRPRQFADVVGQDHIIKPLQSMVERNKVGHAFLFVGPRGCGKTTTARLLSMAMNCPNLSDAGEPCGECGTCKGIINGSGAIGLHELDAASKRGVGDMNALIDTMAMGSVARKKVYIIDECHMLTNEASNALLKTLEEPPADTLIILCTTEANKVLPTIKSRAVTYNFRTVSAELMTSLVQEIVDATGIDIDDAGIAEVVRRGNGSPRDTLTALEGFGGDADAATSDYVPRIAAAVADRDATALVITIAETINAGIGVPDFTRSLLEHWRNCLLSLQAPAALNLSSDDLRQVESDAKDLKTNKVIRLMNVTSEALSKMNSSSDTRLLLETTLLQVSLPETADTLDGIYDYLDDIMAEVKQLRKAVKNGVSVSQSSDWPPVTSDSSPVVETVAKKAEPVLPEPDTEESDAEDEQTSDEPKDDAPVEPDVASVDVPEDASPVDEDGYDETDASEAESDESGYDSYDDTDEGDTAEEGDQESDEDEADDHDDESDTEEADPPVKDISQLFGDDDEDEVVEDDEPVVPVESDRDRKRRERREAREREERGEVEPESEESTPASSVVAGDFHDDDDPNCDCTRCKDEIAEHEQRALRESREREQRDAEESKPQPKLRLVQNEGEKAEPKSKPVAAKKKSSEKVYSQEDCPTASILVETIEGDLVTQKIARYLQPSAISEVLRGDVLVLTVKPKTKLVFTDEVIDTIRATADNLWVSDIEVVV